MRKNFRQFIEKNHLIEPKQRVLVAVSGGIDSIVLAWLFAMSRYKFGIAHCNFHLRGSESDQDAIFVRQLAERLNVPFFMTDFDTITIAEKHKISIQQAARELRYNWFENLIGGEGYASYAIAHHFDDQIETFIINLLRGTGVSGLRGILPKSKNCIRPLLFATRPEIEAFAIEQQLAYREDSSNLKDDYLRNSIRHHILPAMAAARPDFRSGFRRTFKNLALTESFLNSNINRLAKELLIQEDNFLKIDLKKLHQHQPLALILFELLKSFNFNSENAQMISDAIPGTSGKVFFSPTHRVVIDREFLFIIPESRAETAEKEIKALINIDDKEIEKPLKLSFERKAKPEGWKPFRNPDVGQFDMEKLRFPLEIRQPKIGDYFYPIGLGGRKKLSDFFTDLKISAIEKTKIRVITSGNEIIWIISYRQDDRFKITPETKTIYEITFHRNQ